MRQRPARYRWRQSASERLLKLAARTGWSWGPFATLHEVCTTEREHVAMLSRLAAIPPGVSLSLRRLSLLDIFLPDQTGRLKTFLGELFPRPSDLLADLGRRFDETVGPLSYGGWIRVGSISRGIGLPGFSRRARRDELPDWVDHVEVTVRKLLPSVVVLQIDAQLTAAVDKILTDRLKQPTLPRFEITRIDPISLKIVGYSQTPYWTPEIISEWLEQLRAELERRLGLGMLGAFAANNPIPRLPAIEAYQVVDTRNATLDISNWMDENLSWLHFRGFETSGFSLYRDKTSVFSWTTQRLDNGVPDAHRLIVFPQLCTKDEVYTIIDRAMRRVGSWAALIGWVEVTRRDLAELRDKMFKLVIARRRSRTLAPYIFLNDVIQLKARSVDRVSREARESNLALADLFGASAFKQLGHHTSKQNVSDLHCAMKHGLRRGTRELRIEAAQMSRTFSDFVAARNMEASYKLQRKVLWLTIIAAIGSLPAVAAGISWLRRHWSEVAQLFHP
jgi:hypothetical protein